LKSFHIIKKKANKKTEKGPKLVGEIDQPKAPTFRHDFGKDLVSL